MNHRIFSIILTMLLLALIGWAYSTSELIRRPINFMTIPKTHHSPKVDGQLDDECWATGVQVNNFVLTAGKIGEKAKNQTICTLLYDDTHIYISFRCMDAEISSIKANTKMWDDPDILYDDRVEVFLDINHDHRSYYELVVNAKGVQFDQKGYNRLYGSRTCDMDPSWNSFWRAKTSIGKDGWVAEIAIDATSFGVQQIEEGMTWGLNLARVRQPDVEKGDELRDREPSGPAEYSAWTLVHDTIGETISNFHAPIEFGDVVFGNPGFRVKSISLKSALYESGPLGYPSLYGWNPIELQFAEAQKQDVLFKLKVEADSLATWESVEKITITSDTHFASRFWIPKELENKIIIQILEPMTQKQLYRASYIELSPPFIEFNIQSLYARNSSKVVPVQFRLLTDKETRSRSQLELDFVNKKTQQVITSQFFSDLTLADQFTPVFDIDQLRNLDGGNYFIDCKLMNKKDRKITACFKQKLTKFNNSLPIYFHVVDGDYSYGGLTNHAIRVRYPFAAEFVFWRSASYIPWWDCDQAAMSNEFVECWGAGNQGCCEPMQDRECRFSKVELIENSCARVVVHWRYALSDPHYKIYRNEWVDEYYRLYPDGVGVREVNLWPNSATMHEMFEVLLVKPPGIKTEQIFDEQFATLTNLFGEGYSNKYFFRHKLFYQKFIAKYKEFLIEVHFKDRMHPFTVFALRDELLPGVTPAHVDVCSQEVGDADRRGHWPASRFQIDGYNAPGLDVPTHCNIGNIQAEIDPKNQPTTWKFLIGVADKNSSKPMECAKSWLYPGKFEILNQNGSYSSYNFSERAYMLKVGESTKICKLRFVAEKENIVNPVFIIDYPNHSIPHIKIDGKKLDKINFKTAISKDQRIVLFLETSIINSQILTIQFKQKKGAS